MNFPNFEIAIYYCVEFECFNGFAVKKKLVEKNSDGSVRSRCIDCEYSGRIKNNNRIMIRNKRSKKTEFSWHNNLGKENTNRKEYVCSKCKEIGHNSCKK